MGEVDEVRERGRGNVQSSINILSNYRKTIKEPSQFLNVMSLYWVICGVGVGSSWITAISVRIFINKQRKVDQKVPSQFFVDLPNTKSQITIFFITSQGCIIICCYCYQQFINIETLQSTLFVFDTTPFHFSIFSQSAHIFFDLIFAIHHSSPITLPLQHRVPHSFLAYNKSCSSKPIQKHLIQLRKALILNHPSPRATNLKSILITLLITNVVISEEWRQCDGPNGAFADG